MVICKYYRQGNCRYGQYCQFEHINHFGNTKGEDDIIILVAKEVLLAERGGQWLLSCFAPLKERCCIPGMKDVSPEEVRWEIYEAQKNGMVEQAKLHFQQLCQEMKAKREMLKNPSRETITFLKKNLGSKCPGTQQFAAPGNVFASAFGVQNNNPFAGNGFVSSSNASIFGKSNNNTTSVFGGGATFGNNLGGFNGAATSGAGSMFGTTSTSTSFSGVQNSAPAFGTPQSNSIFGGSSQNMFGQNNNVFGGTSQLSNASTTSLFNNSITSQANTSLFGGATTASNLFGGSSTGLQTNSVFGGVSTTSSSGSFNNGMFTQPKTQIPAFGGAPVFGGVTPNYNSNSTGNTIFGGGGQTFGAPAISSSGSIFGGSTAAATPAFGAVVSTTTPTFGTSVVTSTAPGFAATTAPTFDLAQQPSNNTTFGVTASTPNVFATQNTNTMLMGNTPFGAPPVAMNGPFVTANSQQFDSTSTSSAPFSGTGFGVPVANTSNTFGTTETSSNSIFANAATTFATTNGTVSNQSLFSASTFGNVNPVSSPFGSGAATTFTATTTLTSPFAPRTQQGSSPFGNVQNQPNINASPFGKSSCNEIVIDDSVYSAEGTLTDEEKNQFLADSFILGKIPLKPPTKALS